MPKKIEMQIDNFLYLRPLNPFTDMITQQNAEIQPNTVYLQIYF